jgi:hypothetical protein
VSPRLAELTALLDHVAGRFAEGDAVAATNFLVEELWAICQAAPAEEWSRKLAPACRHHPLHALLLHDPYTRRAFEKPRGYAGDAEMLDYVYFGKAPEGTTALGLDVFRVTTGGPNGQSVRTRRDLLAAAIDATAARLEAPVILSVGCGHLREAQLAHAVRSGWRGILYALDQDERSLEVVKHEQESHGVHTTHWRISALLRGQLRLASLDFVYVAGLFDYLSEGLAAHLLRVLFAMLGPEGKLLVANYTPDSRGRAYMEAFMDWKLIYRDEAAMETLVLAVPIGQIAQRSVRRDALGNVVYLELTRHGG